MLKENFWLCCALILFLGYFAGLMTVWAAAYFVERRYLCLKNKNERKIIGRNREIACCFSVLVTIVFLRGETAEKFFFDSCFICLLCCLTLVDLEVCMIPNECVIGIAVLWMVSSFWTGAEGGEALGRITAAMVTILGVLFVLKQAECFFGKECLGRGDVKLLGAVTLYLGTEKALLAFFAAFLAGGIYFLIAGIVFQKRKEAFPLGPFIAVSSFAMLF